MQLDGLTGRVAVVTGAAQGIGLRIAEVLHDQGCRVAGLDVNPMPTAGILGGICDVGDPGSVSAAFARVREELGPVEILVNNAAIFKAVTIEEVSLDWWNRSVAVNYTGVFLCAREVLPGMRERGYGRIVSVGSGGAKTGGVLPTGPYVSTKAAMMTLTKTIAVEYAQHGVTANVVAPIYIATPMLVATGKEDDEMRRRIPVGRLGTPDDVAAVVAFLASSHAGYMTGEVVDLNGGFFID